MDTYKLDSNGILKIINFDKYKYIVLVSGFMAWNGHIVTCYHQVNKNGDIIDLRSRSKVNIRYNDLQHLVSGFMHTNTECILFENDTEFIKWTNRQPSL